LASPRFPTPEQTYQSVTCCRFCPICPRVLTAATAIANATVIPAELVAVLLADVKHADLAVAAAHGLALVVARAAAWWRVFGGDGGGHEEDGDEGEGDVDKLHVVDVGVGLMGMLVLVSRLEWRS